MCNLLAFYSDPTYHETNQIHSVPSIDAEVIVSGCFRSLSGAVYEELMQEICFRPHQEFVHCISTILVELIGIGFPEKK